MHSGNTGKSVLDFVQISSTRDDRLVSNRIVMGTDVFVHGGYVVRLESLEAIACGGSGRFAFARGVLQVVTVRVA